MKLYELTSSQVCKFDGEQIRLGTEGRGRKLVIVPIIGEGHSFAVKKVASGLVIVKGDFPDDERCIAVIKAVGGYSKGRFYEVPEVEGLQKLVEGHYAHGIAGRAGGGAHALCIISSGTEFRLRSKYDESWFSWDGKEWLIESSPERTARLTLRAIDDGEGEWL